MPKLIHNPDVPYLSAFEDDWGPGKMVRIQGTTPPEAERFNVNLQCGSNVSPMSDIAMHISVRMAEGYIARNTLEKGQWGEEQGHGYMPIGSGQQFEMIILCEPTSNKLAINGKHFCDFPHRMPPHRVTHLSIDGNVELALINHENLPSPPAGGYGEDVQQIPTGPQTYGPPGGQGPYAGPPHGGSGQFGPYPQNPPGYAPEEEKSGFESFLGQAGAAIAGAIGTQAMQGALQGGGLQGALGALTGANNQNQPPQTGLPQHPLPGGYGGQSVGGLGSIGAILTNVLAETASGNKQQNQPQQGGYGQPNQTEGGFGNIGSILSNVLAESTSGGNKPTPPQQGGYGQPNQATEGGLGTIGSILSSVLAETASGGNKPNPQQQGGYGPPNQGGYGQQNQGGYGQPNQGGYGQPNQGGQQNQGDGSLGNIGSFLASSLADSFFNSQNQQKK